MKVYFIKKPGQEEVSISDVTLYSRRHDAELAAAEYNRNKNEEPVYVVEMSVQSEFKPSASGGLLRVLMARRDELVALLGNQLERLGNASEQPIVLDLFEPHPEDEARWLQTDLKEVEARIR